MTTTCAPTYADTFRSRMQAQTRARLAALPTTDLARQTREVAADLARGIAGPWNYAIRMEELTRRIGS